MVRIGVVGAGRNGAGHCKRFAGTHAKRCTVAGIADVNEDAAKQLAGEYGAKAFGSLDDMLDEVDAVIVSSPNFLHCEHAVEAAGAGKHVWVEKPMALSLDEADKIVAAVEDAGVCSTVGFSVRFGGIPRTMKQIYQDGKLGDLLSIWSRRVSGGFYKARAKSWRGAFSKSGGVISELIAHEIDWMVDITGLPKSVYCRIASREQDDPRANDHVWLTFAYDEQFTGTIEGSQMGPIADYYKGIVGTNGSTYDQEWGGKLVMQTQKDSVEEVTPMEPFDNHAHFLDVIEGASESVVPVQWGRKIVAITEKALESAVTGKAVDLDIA